MKIKPEYERLTIDQFEVKSKIFHLSGNFKVNGKCITKKDFAKNIQSIGGMCRGYIDKDKCIKKNIAYRKTDYFVIGEGEYKKEEDGEKKYESIKKWNNVEKNNHIFIISQKNCEELIDQWKLKDSFQPPSSLAPR
jgi:hypothetical protein